MRLHLCLVLLQIPKCFGLVQIFCATPKIYLHIVAVGTFKMTRHQSQKKVASRLKNDILLHNFCPFAKCCGPVKIQQNYFGPTEGPGINILLSLFRILEQSVYSQHDVVELVSMLVGAPTIEEQADILHYLVLCYGPRYKILAAQVRVIHILRNQLVSCLFVYFFVCLFDRGFRSMTK